MINTIIFDMGGVLMDFDPVKFVNRYKELSSEDKTTLLDIIFNPETWVKLDFGFYTDEEYVEIVKKLIPKRLHFYVTDIIMKWDDPVIPVEGTADVVRDLKAKGYKMYLLSNAGPRQKEYFKRVPGNECFDATVISSYEKKWKPMPEFYQILLDRYNLNPSECIFIDDLKRNTDAAEALGINTIQFTNAKNLRAELQKRELL